jgi:alpha-beta hydrolase superfamily lysophospholipase
MRQNITLETGTGINPATIFRPEVPAVLFVHGVLSEQAKYFNFAEAVAAQGIVCMTFDLGGHGPSPMRDLNDLTIGDHIEELDDAYKRLEAEPGVDKNRIGIVAASYGAYLATRILDRHVEINKLLLRAPALLPDGLDSVQYRDLDENVVKDFQARHWSRMPYEEVRGATAGLIAVSGFKGEVTIVESELDAVVPKDASHAYITAAHRPTLRVIRNEGHDLSPDAKEMFKKIVVDWSRDLAA